MQYLALLSLYISYLFVGLAHAQDYSEPQILAHAPLCAVSFVPTKLYLELMVIYSMTASLMR